MLRRPTNRCEDIWLAGRREGVAYHRTVLSVLLASVSCSFDFAIRRARFVHIRDTRHMARRRTDGSPLGRRVPYLDGIPARSKCTAERPVVAIGPYGGCFAPIRSILSTGSLTTNDYRPTAAFLNLPAWSPPAPKPGRLLRSAAADEFPATS